MAFLCLKVQSNFFYKSCLYRTMELEHTEGMMSANVKYYKKNPDRSRMDLQEEV